jgi:hypothetical protein
MTIRRYFDLSKAATFGPGGAQTAPAPGAKPQAVSAAWQAAMYLVLVLSILASRFLDLYRAGVADRFGVDWKYLLFVAIVALLVFPVVYTRAQLNRDDPTFVQLVLVFSTGMGWEKILATVTGN